MEVGAEVDDVQAQAVVDDGAEEVDRHGEEESDARERGAEHVHEGSGDGLRRFFLNCFFLTVGGVLVEGEDHAVGEVFSVQSGDGAHGFHGGADLAADEAPAGGLGDEGEDEDEEEDGGDGGGEVEGSP